MKKILLIGGFVIASLGMANAQGTVKFYNTTSAFYVSTNGTAANGTTTGVIATSTAAPSGYYFALLVNTGSPVSATPTSSGWALATSDGTTPITGNNYLLAGALSGTGGANGTAVSGVAPGASAYFEVVGWSASLGTSWSQVAAEYQTGNWIAKGYFGFSTDASIATGGVGSPASSAATLFNTTGGIPTGFLLNGVAPAVTPEPGTIALAGLGIASLLALRRKK